MKSRECKIKGCTNPVWSGGLCKNHTNRSPIKSRKNKESKEEEVSVMRDFFLSIWNKRPHYCENCEKYLGTEPLSYMFDHLLEKSIYSDLKYEEENIMIVCIDCHDLKTRHFFSDYILKRIEEAKIRFNK